MNAKRLCCALAVFFLAQLGEGKVTRVSIGTPPAAWSPRFEDVDRLFVPSAQAVKVVVKDERASGSILGVRRGKGSDLDFFAAEDPLSVGKFVEKSANEAIGLLGLKVGEGGVILEIAIPDFWIETYEFGGSFGAANFLAWGRAVTALRSSDGTQLAVRTDPVAMWYLLAPGSGKALGLSASVLIERLAWEVTASALIPALSLNRIRRRSASSSPSPSVTPRSARPRSSSGLDSRARGTRKSPTGWSGRSGPPRARRCTRKPRWRWRGSRPPARRRSSKRY